MDEASSRFVDRVAVEKLLQQKLSHVRHPPRTADPPHRLKDESPWDLWNFPTEPCHASILFAHGLYEDQRDIYRFLFKTLNRLGYSVHLYCLPYHYERKPLCSQFSGEYFFSADLHRTRDAFRQAADEVVACYERLEQEANHPVFLAGFSMGATIALQASRKIPSVPGICLLNPPAGLAELIWTSPLCQTIRTDLEAADIDQASVDRFFDDIDPLHSGPGTVKSDRVLMIQALYDLVTRQEQYDALASAWIFPHRLKYHAGHLNTLRVPRLAEDMARFFEARIPSKER